MSWASRRQAQYILGIFLVILFVASIFVYPIITKAPSCSDGAQNGGEIGVDCGGPCNKLCTVQVSDPVVLWSRAFPVTGSIYNLAAMIENQNKASGVMNATYEFKVYDTKNKLIGRREGETFIPPNQDLAIFEPRFDAGDNQIHSVSFSFTSALTWVKRAPTLQTLPVRIGSIVFDKGNDSPTLTASINNDSIYDLPGFDVVAILYDADHNAINVSKTHKDALTSNSSALLLFTWPNTLASTPVTEDILTQINPFSVSF
ncbi:MAG: hypothetical protein WCK91_03195 [bacterium]